MLKYTKAKFIGHRDNLKQALELLEGFPLWSYLENGIPVLFANDEECKRSLFKECEGLGIEII